ncbi:MAG TPA: hypothetical protein VG147_12945 [Solirubrobacteraceae bacterium]|jgi:hypothetical protein|nr:hypothetical protein [Solirubrobacteraceae bacterium]
MVLDRTQRDALHQFVVTDLAGVGDVAIILQKGDVAEALRLRHRFEEDLRLLDLLGWRATGDRDCYELMPSEEAVRVLGRLYVRATGRIAQTVAEFSGEYLNQALQVAEACAMALRETRIETEGGG